MFYTAEDVQPAVNAAVKMFGRQGRMDTGKNVFYNVSVFTREYGKLWYGDISKDGIEEKLKMLSASINMNVSLVDEHFEIISTN
jgi:hypothetical protein